MTVTTGYAAVSCVIETKADRGGRIHNSIWRAKFVTCIARADVSVANDLVRRVARNAVGVRVAARRHRHPVALLFVTGRTGSCPNVLRMTKVRPKACHWGKGFQSRRVGFCVARCADRMCIILELRRMAAGTGCVRRKFWG